MTLAEATLKEYIPKPTQPNILSLYVFHGNVEFSSERKEEVKKRKREMDWFQPKRRGPEWKQGWTGQTLGSVSSPPPQFLTIFGIVIVLLWFSQFNTGYEAQMNKNFQLVLFLLPILVIFFLSSYSIGGLINFRFRRPATGSTQRGASPWTIAILVPLILILLYYQPSFR